MINLKNTVFGLLAACLSGLVFSAHAHDFWIAPDSYQAQPGQSLDISIMIGHPTERLQWPIDPHRVISFRSFGPKGIRDHQSAIADYARNNKLGVSFLESGTHMLTIETTQSFSKLESEKFNAYLEEEGLTSIEIDRIKKGTTSDPGTEVYSRRGKSIIQIGELGDKDLAFLTLPVGMTLEIVPMSNPAPLSQNAKMISRIFYRGKPQSGVTVGLVDLSGDLGLTQRQISNKEGYVSFSKPDAGAWMQHAVWSDPLEKSDRADYDTVFSSLSFMMP